MKRLSVQRPDVIRLAKLLHHRQLRKNFVSGVNVSDAGRTLAVELDKTVGVIGKKRVEPGRRRDGAITGIDADQFALNFRQPKVLTINESSSMAASLTFSIALQTVSHTRQMRAKSSSVTK